MVEIEKGNEYPSSDKNLLGIEYLKRLEKVSNPYRNRQALLDSLDFIYDYNREHAKSFAKRIKLQQSDIGNCEAVFAEIIVYAYYLRLFYEGILKSLDIRKDDYDLRIELADGSFHYLEIFCIMPDSEPYNVEEVLAGKVKIEAQEIKTHQQEPFSSVRQKLLCKIEKQKQLSQPRENFAVIEMNRPWIAGDFTILSSLSNGYKITIDTKTNRRIAEGFDWSKSIFEDESVKNLKGIIYFSMGDYGKRKVISNPNFKGVV